MVFYLLATVNVYIVLELTFFYQVTIFEAYEASRF